MAKELNEDTTLQLSIKTLAGIAVLIFTLVGMWFTLQADITEAKEFPSIPLKVTLNEYIEISKFYSTPKSNGFINGVLDKLFIDLKKEGSIVKKGRGLIE